MKTAQIVNIVELLKLEAALLRERIEIQGKIQEAKKAFLSENPDVTPQEFVVDVEGEKYKVKLSHKNKDFIWIEPVVWIDPIKL